METLERPIPRVENRHIRCQNEECARCYKRKPRSDRGRKRTGIKPQAPTETKGLIGVQIAKEAICATEPPRTYLEA